MAILTPALRKVIDEDDSDGDDEIITTISTFSMASYGGVERLTYNGASAATLTGNARDNVITGGSAGDTLLGGDGADQFFGGNGFDTVSYADSAEAMTFDFDWGEFTGIGRWDTFDSIESFRGTNFGDTFIASINVENIDGGNGVDLLSYREATGGVSINLATREYTGYALGDIFTNIEIIEGSEHDDSFVGNTADNIFIGGYGADSFDGGSGVDSVWYVTSGSGVTINLANTNLNSGEASGDSFTSIERFTGSHFNDTLTASNNVAWLAGAGGDDIIRGGASADILFGGNSSDLGAAEIITAINQADLIYGGDGNDEIYSAGHFRGTSPFGEGIDAGTVIYGEAGNDQIVMSSADAYGGIGNDTITVWGAGTAFGGDGDDTLNGEYLDFQLYGGSGADKLNLTIGRGFADGGEGGDVYRTTTVLRSTIRDTGTSSGDIVHLGRVENVSDLVANREGSDLVISSLRDKFTYPDSVVVLEDWFNGYDTIEAFVLADGNYISGDFII